MFEIYTNLYKTLQIDTVFFTIAVVTSLMGSTLQIAHKKLIQVVKVNEIVAVYVTSFCIMIVSYTIGYGYESKIMTMLIGVSCSYVSLDLFRGLKIFLHSIIRKLPNEILELLLKRYLNKKDENSKKGD